MVKNTKGRKYTKITSYLQNIFQSKRKDSIDKENTFSFHTTRAFRPGTKILTSSGPFYRQDMRNASKSKSTPTIVPFSSYLQSCFSYPRHQHTIVTASTLTNASHPLYVLSHLVILFDDVNQRRVYGGCTRSRQGESPRLPHEKGEQAAKTSISAALQGMLVPCYCSEVGVQVQA